MLPALTSLSHGAGCGCKLSAADLRPIVASLPRPADPRVLVAADTADDAGVVQLTDELAIVQTVDFFTPIVDDPYAFGRIAAANALSDVYAMGGRPVTALNLVAFPLERLGPDVLEAILRGGLAVAAEAGVAVVGGHSLDDPEPKEGMAGTRGPPPPGGPSQSGGSAPTCARRSSAAGWRSPPRRASRSSAATPSTIPSPSTAWRSPASPRPRSS